MDELYSPSVAAGGADQRSAPQGFPMYWHHDRIRQKDDRVIFFQITNAWRLARRAMRQHNVTLALLRPRRPAARSFIYAAVAPDRYDNVYGYESRQRANDALNAALKRFTSGGMMARHSPTRQQVERAQPLDFPDRQPAERRAVLRSKSRPTACTFAASTPDAGQHSAAVERLRAAGCSTW